MDNICIHSLLRGEVRSMLVHGDKITDTAEGERLIMNCILVSDVNLSLGSVKQKPESSTCLTCHATGLIVFRT